MDASRSVSGTTANWILMALLFTARVRVHAGPASTLEP
jgi:hypothetical protein